MSFYWQHDIWIIQTIWSIGTNNFLTVVWTVFDSKIWFINPDSRTSGFQIQETVFLKQISEVIFLYFNIANWQQTIICGSL